MMGQGTQNDRGADRPYSGQGLILRRVSHCEASLPEWATYGSTQSGFQSVGARAVFCAAPNFSGERIHNDDSWGRSHPGIPVLSDAGH